MTKLIDIPEIATITYRSGPEWDLRFGRKLRQEDPSHNGSSRTPSLCPDFLIETYLDHQVRFPSGHSFLHLTFLVRESNFV